MDKLLQDFLKFEADEKLFQRKYRGVHYWQTIRFDIANIVDKIVSNQSIYNKEKNKKWLKKKLYIFRNAMFDVRNWNKLKKADILYFDQCSYRNIGGKKVDPYFSYFGFDKAYSIQRCFYLNGGDAKNYMGKGVGTALAELKSYFMILFSKIIPFIFDDPEKRFIYELCDCMNSKFKMDIVPDQVIYKAKKASILYQVYFKYYRDMLKKVKPKAIFVVCHYSDNLWPLYPVAKKMNIPVIELEHGTVINHVSYNYIDLSELGKQLPDYLFTYGDFWDQYISLPTCMKAYSIGNPFLENRHKYYSNEKVEDKKIVIYSDIWEQNGKKLMELALFISNKYYEKGYRVFFKLHPFEYSNWKEKYIGLKRDSKITVLTDEIELYKLLSMARHQIGVCSTVLYEAAVFDVDIYILDTGVGAMYQGAKPLIDSKRACFIHDFYEFEQLMLQDRKEYGDFKDMIWKTNARINAQEVFQRIIC